MKTTSNEDIYMTNNNNQRIDTSLMPPIPNHLSSVAKVIFIGLCHDLIKATLLKPIDGKQLAMLSILIEQSQQVQKLIDANGFVVYDEKVTENSKSKTTLKKPKKNPAFEILISLNRFINDIYDRCGMNPASRNRFKLEEIEQEETEREKKLKEIMGY